MLMIEQDKGRIFTNVICDVCRKRIENGHLGGVQYFKDGSFLFFHKGDCDKNWDNAKAGDGWEELGSFFLRAMMRLNINPVKEFNDIAREEGLTPEKLEEILEAKDAIEERDCLWKQQNTCLPKEATR